MSLLLFACACGQGEQPVERTSEQDTLNGPTADADPRAREIAEQVVQACGGWDAWHKTRHISWSFFGSRNWFWDKYTGDLRMAYPREDLLVLMNVNTEKGRAFIHHQEVTNADTLAQILDLGRKRWVNDSYWLVMPFKLLDPGVRLEYKGQDTTQDGRIAETLQLTFFNEVGYTPENKYIVYVDTENNRLIQWDYFANTTMPEPSISDIWSDYKKYGGILLSSTRGDRNLNPIAVFDALPPQVYNDTASVADLLTTNTILQ